MISLDALNRMNQREFCSALDGVFEHSPWVVERTASRRPFGSRSGLLQALSSELQGADIELQLALLCAHPRLGVPAAERAALTGASRSEQAGAGLDSCTPEQLARLTQLNHAYQDRFGFPFILAVRGQTPASVIAALEQRLGCDLQAERKEALRQVGLIAGYRLEGRVTESAAES